MLANAACVLVRDPRVAAGGFETWVEALAVGLPSHGIRVHVLVPGDDQSVRHRLGEARTVVVAALADPEQQAAAYVAALEELAAAGEHGVFFTMGYHAVNVAGLNLRDSPWLNVPVLHGRHPAAFDWLVAGPPAKIVSPSADYARVVRAMLYARLRWFRAIGRVAVIPHGVTLPPLGDKLSAPVPTPLRVVAATRLDNDTKRPHDLIEIARRAFDRGVPMHLTIAGAGPEEPAMRASAPPNVTLRGLVPHEEIARLLVDSDVLVSTSGSEAFGLSIAEAMAAGCAIVAADIPGPVRELVTSATGIRVEIGDIDAFVDAIMATGARARILGTAGRELVAARFSRARMLRQYAMLIRALGRRTRSNRNWHAPVPLLTKPGQLTLPPVRERLRRKLRL